MVADMSSYVAGAVARAPSVMKAAFCSQRAGCVGSGCHDIKCLR